MNKEIEKLSRQLKEIAEVVNAFESEAVQIKIIERLLPELLNAYRPGSSSVLAEEKATTKNDNFSDLSPSSEKTPGYTKVLRQLMDTDFFLTPRSITDIADFYKIKYGQQLPSSQLSGVLLSFTKQQKLTRTKTDNEKKYSYFKSYSN